MGRGGTQMEGPGMTRWRCGTLFVALGVILLLPGIFLSILGFKAHEKDETTKDMKIIGPACIGSGVLLVIAGIACKCSADVQQVDPVMIVMTTDTPGGPAMITTNMSSTAHAWDRGGANQGPPGYSQPGQHQTEPPPAYDDRLTAAMQADPYLAALVKKQQDAQRRYGDGSNGAAGEGAAGGSSAGTTQVQGMVNGSYQT